MYLIEHSKTEYSHNGLEFKVRDAKQVEIVDAEAIDVYSEFIESDFDYLGDYLAANNLQIIKTK